MVIHAVHVFNKAHEFELTEYNDDSNTNVNMLAYRFTNRLTLMAIITAALLIAYKCFMLTPYYNKYIAWLNELAVKH